MKYHYTAPYLLNPEHKITVDLVGLGGTGSQVLTMLGRISAALIKLGHPGFHIRAWDPDHVSEANIGRQMFSDVDIGLNKAVCLVSRINRFYRTDWEAWPKLYGKMNDGRISSNITISCVDTIKSRFSVAEVLMQVSKLPRVEPTNKPLYWMDFGNAQKTGQVVLGTCQSVEQPAELPEDQVALTEVPHVLQFFPKLKKQREDASGPSCSLAEALSKQDLFINSTLCNLGMAILWKMFRELRISHHGAYLNLETLSVNAIKL